MRLLSARWPVAAALLGLAMPATASAVTTTAATASSITPSISRYTAGMPAGSAPRGVTLGDDGNVWFADHGIPSAEAIGFITPGGSITRYTAGISNNVGVRDVVQGPGGIWFSEFDVKQVGVVRPGGAVTEYNGLFENPAGITVGPDGAVWMAEDNGPSAIGRITAAGAISEYNAGLSSGPNDIATGADGNLWFTEPGAQTIGRITPFGVITEYGAGITGDPQEITAGPDGNLWFTQTNPAAIGRITPLGAVTEFSAGLPAGSAPQAITNGSDGHLYFTDNGANAIGQVTTTGAITEFSAGLTPGADLRGITTGSDGALWFAEHIGAIGRMTVGPTVWAPAVGDVDSTSASLKAQAQSGGAPATFAFEYGTTQSYGESASGASTGESKNIKGRLTGLQPGTTYHVRAVVKTPTGTAQSSDVTFTTAAAPEVPTSDTALDNAGPGPATVHEAAAKPELGRSVVGGVVSGTVLVTDPVTGKTHHLGAHDRVKTGAILDTRRGKVSIVSALDAKGHTQKATFWAGKFQVRQTRSGGGMVELRLLGKPEGCGSASARAARKGAKPVKLWGKDRGGRYRTVGNSSVATVRGTEWLVMETCAGTVTRVVEGAVSVWDRALHKRILLKAGPRAAAHVARASR